MKTDQNKAAFVHSTAEVHPGSTIGEGTRVWNQAQVRENVAIGRNCNLGKNTYIDTNVKIGNNVKIQNNVSIYDGVTVEDNVFIGPDVSFATDRYPRAKLWSEERKGRILLKKGCSIGANASIIANVTLGEHSLVAVGSIVTKDVPPHALVVGAPARIKGYVCECGFRGEEMGSDNSHINFKCTGCGNSFSVKKQPDEGKK